MYTDNCLFFYIIDVKHIDDTNCKQCDIFLFLFTGSKLQVSKFAWQTLWEVMSFQESQQGHLFTNLLAATLSESPFLLSKAGHLNLRYFLFCCFNLV